MKTRSSLILGVAFAVTTFPSVAQADTNLLPTSGNVGIGTTSPAQLLHLRGGNAWAVFERGSTSNVAIATFANTGNAPAWGLGLLDTSNTLSIFNYTDSTTALSILANGNVGVGTTSPRQRLDVLTTSSTFLHVSNSGTYGAYINGSSAFSGGAAFFGNYKHNIDDSSLSVAVGAGDYGMLFGDGVKFYGSSGLTDGNNFSPIERMRIDAFGNVGIGTTSPGRKLDVNGDVNVGTNLVVNTGLYYGTSYSLGTAGYAFRNSTGGDLVKITDAGNVGIGTTTPTQKLAVNGTIRAKEVIVDTGWSDYVFKPEYHLASLSEVEGAIQKDGHLPGIPSAAQVAEHGVSLGEMQSKLLAKIEELTLHQIEQEKRLNDQSARIARLEQENTALRRGATP